MSALLLVMLSATASAALGYLARRRARAIVGPPTIGPNVPLEATLPQPFDGLALAPDDVVCADGEERWLAGALLAREGKHVQAAIFMAPEGAEVRAVAILVPQGRAIFWLTRADVACPAEPPGAIEIHGLALSRRWRLPVSIERHGQGAPQVGDTGILAFYEAGARDVALVLTGTAAPCAWVGRRYDESEYERLGTGKAR